MELFFKRYGWTVHLGLIALAAILIGWSANKGIAILLAPHTVPEVAQFEGTKTTKTTPKTSSRNKNLKTTIIGRCLFGCADEAPAEVCEGGCEDGQVCQNGTCVDAEPTEIVNSEIPVESDMNVKLMGCMVAKKSEYSLALLQEGTNTFIVGVGESVGAENAEILEIRRDRIIIRRNNRLEFIRLVNSIGGAPSRNPQTAALSAFPPAATDVKRVPSIDEAKAAAKATKAEANKDVKKVGDNTFEIDRKALQAQLSDPETLAKQARIVPNYKDGKTHGIKLIGVNSDSVYSKVGIRNGDIVLSINGNKITSQAKALELMQGLKNEKSVAIEVDRKGTTETFKYDVK